MTQPAQQKDVLHGVTLEAIINKLVDHYGWEGLADRINLNCFKNEPSVKSSLKFLRKTPWARTKVEQLYISTVTQKSPWDNSKWKTRNTPE